MRKRNGVSECWLWSLNMAKPRSFRGLCPLDPARGLASRPDPFEALRQAPISVESCRKFLHLSLCSQTAINFSMPCINGSGPFKVNDEVPVRALVQKKYTPTDRKHIHIWQYIWPHIYLFMVIFMAPLAKPLQGVQECSIPCFRKIIKISNQQWA